MRLVLLPLCVLVVLFAGFARGFAAELEMDTVRTTVTYVSATELYVDAGRTNHIELGNEGDVFHKRTLVAHVEVVFAADHSASCHIVEKIKNAQIGDSALIVVSAVKAQPAAESAKTAVVIAPVAKSAPPARRPAQNVLSARVAVQSYLYNDHAMSGRDYVEPAVVMNGTLRNIAGTHLSFVWRTRSRRQDLPPVIGDATQKRWDHQVYEMGLAYDDPTSDVYVGMGRLRAGEISGMGELDGLLFTYGQRHGLRAGFFTGTQPNDQTSSMQIDLVKSGLLAVYETGSGVQQFSSTLALSGEYYRGSVSREFAYVQTSWNASRLLSFYQNAEINYYRGWRRVAEGKTFELTNVLANAVFSPWKRLTTTLGYDALTNYRTYETRSLADSLFDGSLWQGTRATADLRLPWRITLGVGGGLRRRAGDAETMRNGSLSLGINNPFGSQFMVNARLNTLTNATLSGQQPLVGLSRQVFAKWLLSVQVGQDRYLRRSDQQNTKSNWLHASADYDVTRFLYLSTYAEFYRGGGEDTDRYLLELGLRY